MGEITVVFTMGKEEKTIVVNQSNSDIKQTVIDEILHNFRRKLETELQIMQVEEVEEDESVNKDVETMLWKVFLHTEELFINGDYDTDHLRCHHFKMETNRAILSFKNVNTEKEQWGCEIKFEKIGQTKYSFKASHSYNGLQFIEFRSTMEEAFEKLSQGIYNA